MGDYSPLSTEDPSKVKAAPKTVPKAAPKATPKNGEPEGCFICKKKVFLHKLFLPCYSYSCILCDIKTGMEITLSDYQNEIKCGTYNCPNYGSCKWTHIRNLCDACDTLSERKITVTVHIDKKDPPIKKTFLGSKTKIDEFIKKCLDEMQISWTTVSCTITTTCQADHKITNFSQTFTAAGINSDAVFVIKERSQSP